MPFSQYLTATGQTLAATTPPPVPTGLTATIGSNQVVLRWTGSLDATGYVVEMRPLDGVWSNAYTGTAVQATVTGLTPETDYEFRVKAVNSVGESGWADKAVSTVPHDGRTRIIRFTHFDACTPESSNVIKGG